MLICGTLGTRVAAEHAEQLADVARNYVANVGGTFAEILSIFEKQQTQIQASMEAKDAKTEQQRSDFYRIRGCHGRKGCEDGTTDT